MLTQCRKAIRRGMRRSCELKALLLLVAVGCTPTPVRSAPARSPNSYSAREILPADLDVVVWLDLGRLRGFWPLHPDRQIARSLAEYGVFGATASATPEAPGDLGFWLELLKRSDRWWLACRPSMVGCVDTVVFARGRFSGTYPTERLDHMTSPIDLGAGWFRFERKRQTRRGELARVYLAPADRYVAVSSGELDAVERTLERGQHGLALDLQERGLVAMTVRARGLARLLEKRAPAAARLLHDAKTIKLSLDSHNGTLDLDVSIEFDEYDRAERARHAFSILVSELARMDNRMATLETPRVDVVARELLIHLRLPTKTPSNASPRTPQSSSEPAAE
jgi:hypothetical protein